MKNLVSQHVRVSYQRLPPALDGLRIVQVSDIHFTFRSSRRYRRLREQIVAASPDVIAFTGDMVNHHRWWDRAVDWIAALPAEIPKVAVPGNWEYRAAGGAGPFRRSMERAGVRPLLNQAALIPVRDGIIQVVGFDDIRYGRFEPDAAFKDIDPDQFVVALCHNPDILLYTDPDRFDLLLCGHTHGGQVRMPRYGAITTSTRLGKRYEAGRYELAPERYLYVSRGLGEGHIWVRLLCPPELVVVTLHSLRA